MEERNSADDRRKEREKIMVQEGLEYVKRKREDQWHQKLREQRELRDMLTKYSPWGRPGNGAPNPDGIRKRKLQLEGLFPEEPKTGAAVILGRPGGGAPRRTTSGHVHTFTREDPILRFQLHDNTRACVDNVLRYRAPVSKQQQYKLELDAMVQEKQRIQNEEARKLAELEQKMFAEFFPWGRPGPGGTLWRDQRTIGLNFLYSLDQYPKFHYRISLYPLTHSPPAIYSKGWSDETTLRAMSSRRTRRDLTAVDCEGSVNEVYGVELVPLLARRRKHPDSYNLSTTDVTNVRPVPGKWMPHHDTSRDYMRELSTQVSSKQQQLQEARRQDIESSRRHFETWQQFWGRPGHGAPREIKVKGNIDVLLHHIPVK